MPKSTHPAPSVATPRTDNVRAAISLALFVHLFVVFVCLAGNLVPSELERRLLRLFRPYAQLLNFDLDGTRYYLTHAAAGDVDHRWEVLPEVAEEGGDDGWRILRHGVRGGERYHRYQRFADVLAFFEENDDVTALLAEGVARHLGSQRGQPIVEIRGRRHTLQSFGDAWSGATDPDDAAYLGEFYRAYVLSPGPGEYRILKRENAALEAAVKPAGGAP